MTELWIRIPRLLCAAALLAQGACKEPGGASTAASGGVVSYSRVVSTTLESYGCTACHGGEGGLTLTTYRGLMTGGVSGPAVLPGDGARSLLVRKLLGAGPGRQMPLGGTPLPRSKIDAIATWIDQGALDN